MKEQEIQNKVNDLQKLQSANDLLNQIHKLSTQLVSDEKEYDIKIAIEVTEHVSEEKQKEMIDRAESLRKKADVFGGFMGFLQNKDSFMKEVKEMNEEVERLKKGTCLQCDTDMKHGIRFLGVMGERMKSEVERLEKLV